jgi:hypothetical protein
MTWLNAARPPSDPDDAWRLAFDWNGVAGFMAGEGHCGLDGKMDVHEPACPDALQTAREQGQMLRRAATTMAKLQWLVQTSA